MTKLEIEAIRALPESMVKDGIVVGEFNGAVILAHRDTIPLKYLPERKEWVEFDPTPLSSDSKQA